MARIAGVDVPGRKQVCISLRYIYGIGPHRARLICKQAEIPENKITDQLKLSQKRVWRLLEKANLRRP